MLSLLALLPAAAAADLDQAIVDALALYNRHAAWVIPSLDDEQRADLLDGDVVKIRLPGGEGAPDGAMGMILIDGDHRELWMGSCDPHEEEAEALTSYDMPILGEELFRWYGFIDLPAPFKDRHFLIQTTVNPGVSQATGGAIWERSWALEADGVETMRPVVASGAIEGLTLKAFDAAIYVPINHGAWATLALPDGKALLLYHASTSLGGEIPDGLMVRYVFWGLDEVLGGVRGRAQRMPGHYLAGHEVLIGGDNQPIPYYEAR